MSNVVFSSWAGKVVDNRGLGKYVSIDELELPLYYDSRKVRAIMSWKGLVVVDGEVNIVDIAHSYLKEVQKLSCGECSVGYLGIKVMFEVLSRLVNGERGEKGIELLRRLGAGIREGSTKCDFCALAVTPVLDSLKYFQEEYTRLLGGGPLSKSDYKIRVTAPCMEACPAHQDVPGYIELIRNRRYPEALEVIRKTNCLPGVTGRACVAFCESNCVRGDLEAPLAIRALKRVPADFEVASGSASGSEKKGGGGTKVAVIGAGPAGLAAAYKLALTGHEVTIFDEQPAAGGMALVGIPAYRLPRQVLQREVDIIQGMGIEVRLNTRIGKDTTLEQLSKQGYKAVFIATGAHKGQELGIGAEGVTDGVEFLHSVNIGERVEAKDRVIVVGGGNAAVDCARTCMRLGFKEVTIVYRRSRAEMPASSEEVEAAENEGVKIAFLATPTKILTGGGKITGVECVKMELGEPDDSGRRRPIPVKGSEFVIETDMVIPAVGEMPELSFATGSGISTTERGTLVIDQSSCQTSVPGVFAGGDCVTGPASLIEAVAAGNRAAKNIDEYLRAGKVTTEEDKGEDWACKVARDKQRNGGMVARRPRQSPEELAISDRSLNFDEVEHGFTYETAAKEARRCLRCYRVLLLAVDGRK